MARDFRYDFLIPALRDLSPEQGRQVAIALDAAICFGVLEAMDGSESLQNRALVEAKYADNVARLKAASGPAFVSGPSKLELGKKKKDMS